MGLPGCLHRVYARQLCLQPGDGKLDTPNVLVSLRDFVGWELFLGLSRKTALGRERPRFPECPWAFAESSWDLSGRRARNSWTAQDHSLRDSMVATVSQYRLCAATTRCLTCLSLTNMSSEPFLGVVFGGGLPLPCCLGVAFHSVGRRSTKLC